MTSDNQDSLLKIRSVADYQLGKGAGKALFPDEVKIIFSKSTGRIRHIYLGDELLATLRPTDGMFSLTLAGARRLMKLLKPPRLWVKVLKDVEPFIEHGKSVFARHVVDADEEILPQEEVMILGEDKRQILAVGKAVLTGKEMKAFKHGVAVKVRRGASEVKS